MATLQLTRAPLSSFEILQKRVFDVIIAGTALAVLTPFLAVIALLIRLDSPGPVFFRQRRYGFNQQMFRIIKFRTMTTLDDGDIVRQACRNDHRITIAQVGRERFFHQHVHPGIGRGNSWLGVQGVRGGDADCIDARFTQHCANVGE